ncbi:hypothetical protein CAEBREN_30661 [Caenorhabditis brenneri]|uniref:SCP domain-containing protein n=1 Tax=Caenorhabditis brenneri TaxID=135651 RepID=G0MHN9_CAEBE|nr:hypothetical protein CAEBREN_30661 [Caenorhabditis brenneri]
MTSTTSVSVWWKLFKTWFSYRLSNFLLYFLLPFFLFSPYHSIENFHFHFSLLILIRKSHQLFLDGFFGFFFFQESVPAPASSWWTQKQYTRHALCLLMTIMNVILFAVTLFLILSNIRSDVIEGSGNDQLIEEKVWNNVDDKIVEALGGLDDELLTEHVCNESTITQLQQEIILTTHNELRRSLAFGKQRNKRGLMNSARNMYKLDWDCELAALAANWSASCPQHFMPQSVLGSNAQLFKRFYFYFDGHDSTVHMRNAMKYWWQQGEERGNEDAKNRFYARRNYFGWANMAKGKTYRVGCSYIQCGDQESALFTCLYNEKYIFLHI